VNDVTGMMAPALNRVSAYFAPVNRASRQASIFDPAQNGSFNLSTPPAPWIRLGWIDGFNRKCGSKIEPIRMGAPASTAFQAKTEVEAIVSFSFQSWGKLQLALSSGTQQMNLLQVAAGASLERSGGTAVTATVLQAGSTANVLQVGTAISTFATGGLVAVDVDYLAQTGFIGSGVSGAYVTSALADIDYVRRVSLNVGRITSISGTGAIMLEYPLLAGIPTLAMKVSNVVGFCDREGSSFFQEWSAVFIGEGQQGERIIWHYPRLQAMNGIAETNIAATGGYEKVELSAAFRALPVSDPVDGETVVCFRSYVAG